MSSIQRPSLLTGLTTLSVSISLLMSGCTPPSVNPELKAETSIKGLVSTETSTSVDLAEAGELLMDPVNFPVATKLMNAALAADPENPKAQLYSSLLKVINVFRGAVPKFRPYAIARQDGAQYDSAVNSVPDYTKIRSPLQSFLMDKTAPVVTNNLELQDFILEWQKAFGELRQTAKKLRNQSITLKFNPMVWKDLTLERRQQFCFVVDQGDHRYAYDCKPNALEMIANEADFYAIQQWAAGMQMYLSMLTSYSVKNSELVEAYAKEGKRSQEEAMQFVKTLPGFLTLRKDSQLHLWGELGSDLLIAVRWVAANQASLCPYNSAERVRPDNLFQQGACIGDRDSFEAMFDLYMKAWNGPSEQTLADGKGKVLVDITALWRTPIQDLKTKFPAHLNNCGIGANFPDPTMGGILPNGDLNQLIDSECN